MDSLHKALAEDPDAAWSPILERGFEPPLCFAARETGLTADVVRLLVAHGAQPDATDINGWSALPLLSKRAATIFSHCEQERMDEDFVYALRAQLLPQVEGPEVRQRSLVPVLEKVIHDTINTAMDKVKDLLVKFLKLIKPALEQEGKWKGGGKQRCGGRPRPGP